LYKVLGEIEMRQGNSARARELFALGLKRDPHCASLYHAAALLEAKLGNLEVSTIMAATFYSHLVRLLYLGFMPFSAGK
jgi:hypothetical protein